MYREPTDFLEETESLHAIMAKLTDSKFETRTLFKGWTFNDILTHLHFWNKAAVLSIDDENEFEALMQRTKHQGSTREKLHFEEANIGAIRGTELRGIWREYAQVTAKKFQEISPKERLKWVDLSMSARSSITARLMETWAHGQAIYDVLDEIRIDSDRLKSIAFLGVNTFAWSFKIRKIPVPDQPPYLKLIAPSGRIWTWNDVTSNSVVQGSATEFCQVVTQTRNISDTALKIAGETARKWMAIAQCFAGPPSDPPAVGTRRTFTKDCVKARCN